MIEIINLSKSFGPKRILTDINVRFESGMIYGIVGENGAGKTTFFRCIAELEDYQGNIKCEENDLKNNLGFLPSEPYFLPKITGEEHVFLLTDARKIKVKNLSDRNIFRLPLKEYVSNYSTGMKKKLGITSVLLQKNKYYIFDEPFNGIDLESSILFSEILKKLKELGKTILISSHIFSTLKDSCDYIYKIEDGRFSRQFTQENFNELEDEMRHKILMKDIGKLLKD